MKYNVIREYIFCTIQSYKELFFNLVKIVSMPVYLLYKSLLSNKFYIILLFFILCQNYKDLQANNIKSNKEKKRAIALFGDVKYKPGFKHLDYVDKLAKVGGVLHIGVNGHFDSLNPFIIRGIAANGIDLTYDSLLKSTDDEISVYYGLLAEYFIHDAKKKEIIFKLRDFAKWHDGSNITAEDIKFSFQTFKKKSHPLYRTILLKVKDIKLLGIRKIKFKYTGDYIKAIRVIGSLPIISKAYFTKNDFAKPFTKAFLGSGPYIIENSKVKFDKSITYKKFSNYWGRNLPINKYQYNFNKIEYKYYVDIMAMVRAFKVGEYDFRIENISKIWNTAYNIKKVKTGEIIKKEIPNNRPVAMQGFILNMRKEKFQNRYARKALSLVFDFEWINNKIFYNAYDRLDSYYKNSLFEHKGDISLQELAILKEMEQLGVKLDKDLKLDIQHKFIPNGNLKAREKLIKAQELLKKAGFYIDKKTLKLKSKATGEFFVIELLVYSSSYLKAIIPYISNLKKLGIDVVIRQIDSSQYQKRLEQYDFDMVMMAFGNNIIIGEEQYYRFHSSQVNKVGGNNYMGINNKIIDYLVEKIKSTTDLEKLKHYGSLLDRILLNNYYLITNWYSSKDRIIFYKKLKMPKIMPQYNLAIRSTWWIEPEQDNNKNNNHGQK